MDGYTYGTVLPCSREKVPQNDAKYKLVSETPLDGLSMTVVGYRL